jgi:MATE family multidrug resistance protein
MRAFAADLRDMARIAAPIVAVNVGIQAMGVVDTFMVGKLGGAAIAAVGLGNFYFFNVAIFGIGLLFALDPIIAQAVGAGDHDAVALGVQRGLVLAAIIAVIVSFALLPGEWVLSALEQPDDVIEPTAEYTRRRMWGALPFMVFNVLRQTLQAMGPVRHIVIAVVFANVVNVFANWVLIYGNLGFAAQGVVGSGIATAISMWVMTSSLLFLAWPLLRPAILPWQQRVFEMRAMRRIVGIGAPIGVQWFFESFAFGLTALFMGWMSTASLAGHEIALNMAALTFMVPLGISGAAAAVVGRAIGRGDMVAARRDAILAIACGVGFMTASATVFIAFPDFLAGLYTTETATFMVATSLIPLAGVFQIFDGTQAVTSGVLRATGDTRIPAMLHMVAFWGVGIPLGAYLGFKTPLRERGLWWGLVAGLAAAALLQSWRVKVRLAKDIARVRVDHHETDR